MNPPTIDQFVDQYLDRVVGLLLRSHADAREHTVNAAKSEADAAASGRAMLAQMRAARLLLSDIYRGLTGDKPRPDAKGGGK